MLFFSRRTRKTKGFALLFSIIVISIVVTTTAAISKITRRELGRTSYGQKSMEAFFAADAGIECALYWDIRKRSEDKFSRSGSSSPDSTIQCVGNTGVSVDGDSGSGYDHKYTFSLSGEFCADVTITMDGLDTVVDSRGYSSCNASDPNRVERGLKALY